MSVIQTLRGRGSVVVTIMLILALVAFIFMDSFQNVGEIFREDRTLIAEVNGERIETNKYSREYQSYEQAVQKNQQKTSFTDQELENTRIQFWNTKLTSVLINQECDILGIVVTDKERNAMFTSNDADPVVLQNFTDPKTGQFDPQQVIQYEKQLMQSKEPNAQQMRKEWGRFKVELVKQRRTNKYVALIKQGIYVPKFMMDEMGKQNHVTANIDYVKVPYEAIDSKNIKVTDAEIKEYMAARGNTYITSEDQLAFEYVSFPIIPSSRDSNLALDFLNNKKEGFITSEDAFDFASKHTDKLTDNKFYNTNSYKNSNKEVILAAPVGEVVGPYFDNGMFKLTKVVEKKSLPDSVKSAHILIQPSQTLSLEQAEALADSILDAVVKKGANFAETAKARSADQGTALKGGEIGYAAKGMGLAKEYEEFIFSGTKGKIEKIKTQFGFHIIKIQDQKSFQPNVKVATIAKLLEAGNETKSKAQQKANDFATEAKDEKTFSSAAKKLGIDKRIAKGIKSTQGIVQGLGNVRQLVRWAYANEIGAISPAQVYADKLVVARLTTKNKQGELQDVVTIRPQVESIIRRNKQAAQLAAKVKNADLTAIATMYNTEVKHADSLKMQGMSNPDLGYEAKVLAAALNKDNMKKVSAPIPGQAGIYFVKTKTIDDNMKNAARIPQLERVQVQGQYLNSVEQFIPLVLKKRATINDNRSVSLTY